MTVAGLIVCAQLFAIDGDTVQCDGARLRLLGPGQPFVDGFDTPETGERAECERERRIGALAKVRLSELLQAPNLRIEHSGEQDQYGRGLVWVKTETGHSAGEILLDEGLAQPWPHDGNIWCAGR